MTKQLMGILLTCAWILWREDVPLFDAPRVWELESPHETREQCEQARAKEFDFYRRQPSTTGYEVSDDRITLTVSRGIIGIFLQCWPDTIAPRAK
jgi:hypothetical protein